MRTPSCFSYIPKKWRVPPKVMYAIFALELAFSVPALALYGIAKPDTYRTRLWQEGYNHGWNSPPNEVLYAYANYRPIPNPLPWSQLYVSTAPSSHHAASSIAEPPLIRMRSTTSYSVILAILSLFIQLMKGIMFICGVFYPLLSLIIHAALTALWAVSLHAQAGSDMTDPDHPQPGPPWYITKSCGAPISVGNQGYCKQAKAAFAVGICLWYEATAFSYRSLQSLH